MKRERFPQKYRIRNSLTVDVRILVDQRVVHSFSVLLVLQVESQSMAAPSRWVEFSRQLTLLDYVKPMNWFLLPMKY